MYAVIKAGAHQYRVTPGASICVDFRQGNAGDVITFDEVLLVGGDHAKVGSPLVAGATVEAVIKRQRKEKKIIVFKFKRRKGYKRKRGHRQLTTEIEIKGIQVS